MLLLLLLLLFRENKPTCRLNVRHKPTLMIKGKNVLFHIAVSLPFQDNNFRKKNGKIRELDLNPIHRNRILALPPEGFKKGVNDLPPMTNRRALLK